MKKKLMRKTAVLALGVMLGACRKEVLPAAEDIPEVRDGRELFCLSNTREEAEETAGQYGIELVDYQDGVAVFHCEGDPASLIETGKKNGWKELSLNTADTTVK